MKQTSLFTDSETIDIETFNNNTTINTNNLVDRKVLFEIVDKFTQYKKGLSVIPFPTGFGKTHNSLLVAVEFILELLKDDKEEEKKYDFSRIIFLTNVKKNLDMGKLKKLIGERKEDWKQYVDEEDDIYEKYVLFVDSNYDLAKRFFAVKDNLDSLPEKIRQMPSYKKLRKSFENLKEAEDKNYDRDTLKEKEQNIREKYEKSFRQALRSYFQEQYPILEERKKAVKGIHKWLSKIYPTVFTDEYKVLFMSVDKFLVRNSSIISKSTLYLSDEFLSKSLIFMDEFDSCYNTILNNIVRKVYDSIIDIVDLFKAIHKGFLDNIIPKAIYEHTELIENLQEQAKNQESTSVEKQIEEKKELKKIIAELKKEAEQIFTDLSLELALKVQNPDKKRQFLFQIAGLFSTVLTSNKTHVLLNKNEGKSLQEICFVDKEEFEPNSPSILDVLSKIENYIQRFINKSRIIASHYEKYKNFLITQEDKNQDKFTFENALKTFFNALQLYNSKHKDYLFNRAMQMTTTWESKDELLTKKGHLQFRGYNVFEFLDDYKHDCNSKIQSIIFHQTPNSILYDIVQKCNLIGLSATATFESVIVNFDLELLEELLEDNYRTLDYADKKRLRSYYDFDTLGYKKIDIKASFTPSNKDIPSFIDKVYKNEYNRKQARRIFINLKIDNPDWDKNYYELRYLRIASVFKYFLSNKTIKSFLCLLTSYPSRYNKNLNIDILYKLFGMLTMEFPDSGLNSSIKTLKNNCPILTSSKFIENWNLIKRDLENGKRKFIISVYQAVGAGVNLDYAIPQNIDFSQLINIDSSGHKRVSTKDIDAIYLDKPTNIINNNFNEFNSGKKDSDINRLISIHHILSLSNAAKITFEDEKKMIKEVLRASKTMNFIGRKYYELYEKEDFKWAVMKNILQAVGRMSRTNVKNNTIHLLVDERLKKTLAWFPYEEHIVLKELEVLCISAREKVRTQKSITSKSLENLAATANRETYYVINNRLNREWTDKTIQEWEEWRTFVLKNPTIDSTRYSTLDRTKQRFYIKLPKKGHKYWYWLVNIKNTSENYNDYSKKTEFQNDYLDVDVFFEKPSNQNCIEVSAESARLNIISKNLKIREHLKREGVPIEFSENEYIISPIVFNNFYKGVIGEEVGKFILESEFNIKLLNLEEKEYEQFDYKFCKDDTWFYLDMKHWKPSFNVDSGSYKEKIRKKIERVNSVMETGDINKAFIINLLGKSHYEYKETNDSLIGEVPGLLDEESGTLINSHLDKLKSLKNI